jgi:hypothetical protein
MLLRKGVAPSAGQRPAIRHSYEVLAYFDVTLSGEFTRAVQGKNGKDYSANQVIANVVPFPVRSRNGSRAGLSPRDMPTLNEHSITRQFCSLFNGQ